MSFKINQLKGDGTTTYLSQEMSDIRYVNQNFEDPFEFDLNLNNHEIVQLKQGVMNSSAATTGFVKETSAAINTSISTINNTLNSISTTVSSHTTSITDLGNFDTNTQNTITGILTTNSSQATSITNLNNNIINLTNADTTINTSITTLDTKFTNKIHNNFAVRLYQQSNAGAYAYGYFLTSSPLSSVGDITIVQNTASLNNQIRVKLGTTSAAATYLLSGISRTDRGVCTLKLLRHRPGYTNVSLTVWKSNGGNVGENMEYPFSKILDDCRKNDEYYFQFWNSPAEYILSIDFVLIPITNAAAGWSDQ